MLPKEDISSYLKMQYKNLLNYKKNDVSDRNDIKVVTNSPMCTWWSMNENYVITVTI